MGGAGHPHALRARVLSFVLLACLLPNVELDVGEDNAEDHDAHEEQQLAQRVLAQAVAEDAVVEHALARDGLARAAIRLVDRVVLVPRGQVRDDLGGRKQNKGPRLKITTNQIKHVFTI